MIRQLIDFRCLRMVGHRGAFGGVCTFVRESPTLDSYQQTLGLRLSASVSPILLPQHRESL